VPELSIFLDVLCLTDTSPEALEKHIYESDSVLLFLSRGYFRSNACAAEYREATTLGKALILVHDADPAHGGAPLEDIKQECPEELLDLIFEGRPTVPWLRSPSHKLVTFKHIVFLILKATQTPLPSLSAGERDLDSQLMGHLHLGHHSDPPLTVFTDTKRRGSVLQPKRRSVQRGSITAKEEREAFRLLESVELLYATHNAGVSQVVERLVDDIVGLNSSCVAMDGVPVPAALPVAAGKRRPLKVSTTAAKLRANRAQVGSLAKEATSKHITSTAVSKRLTTAAISRRVTLAPGQDDRPESASREAFSRASLRQRGQAAPLAVPSHLPLELDSSAKRHIFIFNLNALIFSDDGELEHVLAQAVATPNLEWLLIHQADAELDGCPFEQIIERTPHALLRLGIYRPIAHRWYHEASFCAVTVSFIAKSLEAIPNERQLTRRASMGASFSKSKQRSSLGTASASSPRLPKTAYAAAPRAAGPSAAPHLETSASAEHGSDASV